jgi:CO/xanthine dehydrogenase Mo-binding subunit
MPSEPLEHHRHKKQTMPPAVGSAVQRIDVLDKLLGTATFTADLALPGMLHAHLLLSAHAHARIRSIDTSTAEQMPGVCAVRSANNTPPYRFGSEFPDQALFDRHKALHRGAVLAAVAAQDAATALLGQIGYRSGYRYNGLPLSAYATGGEPWT